MLIMEWGPMKEMSEERRGRTVISKGNTRRKGGEGGDTCQAGHELL